MISHRRAIVAVMAALALPALVPASAGAHAALLKERPAASGILNAAPAQVRLLYSEPVEPRFAIVSVTDQNGNRVTSARPARSPSNADELDVPLKKLSKGWYLVYWRVISVDGHPVRGAFTFAVGPNAGPPPQFDVPSLTETAATPGLVITRWLVLLSLMCSVGLLAFRLLVARVLLRRVPESSLRAVSIGLAASLAVAIVAAAVYVLMATAEFAQVGFFDFSTTLPLVRDSAFGRGYSDLVFVLALLAVAAAIAVRIDQPRREHRSVAELGATGGALLAAAAALAIPGLAGHASTYAPRGYSLVLDWSHMLAGGVWVGGLVGLTILGFAAGAARVACMVVVVPRFSRVALGSVLLLITSGTLAALGRLPTLASLWDTGYGQALIVKIGLLLGALVIAAVNLLRTTPRLGASDRRPELAAPATTLLRRLVGGEVLLTFSAVFAAGVMSSLAPPPQSLAEIGTAQAKVGPGKVDHMVKEGGYQLQFGVSPNRAARPNAFSVKVTKDGKPVSGADVVAKFTMLDMEMGQQSFKLKEVSPSFYRLGGGVLPLVMAGHWGLDFTIAPRGEKPFQILLLDKALG
ncbi:MAG: copper transport protein [Solirubrobacteraceae bacterium]|nr:copper transport protein [Solirubrobacteraceae bacterium]